MDNSIETIWNEGFLNEKASVVPKINDLYNQRSKYLVDRIKRMFRANLWMIGAMAVLMPVILYFIGALWQGLAAAFLLLAFGWYSSRQVRAIQGLDFGTNSYDYLKNYRQWLREVIQKNERIMRFFYPLNLLIALSIILSAWNAQEELQLKFMARFPDLIYIDGIPLLALIVFGILLVVMTLFSGKIYRWDVAMVYGRVFNKLDETIQEMEQLKSE